jgi:hypothetical protein
MELLPIFPCDASQGGCGAPAGQPCADDCAGAGASSADELGDPDEAYEAYRDGLIEAHPYAY